VLTVKAVATAVAVVTLRQAHLKVKEVMVVIGQ